MPKFALKLLARLKQSRILFICIFTVIAAVLWLISSIQAQSNILAGIGNLGFFSVLPFAFFLGFSLLVTAFLVTVFYADKYRTTLLLSQTILLILMLYFTLTIVEGTPRFTASYVNFRATDFITQTGHFDPTATWILNWPSFSVVISILAQITAIPEALILSLYPTAFNIALIVPLFLFFRMFLKDSKMLWLAIWFVFLGNWVGQDYFSMQSIVFLIILTMLPLLFKSMDGKTRNRQSAVIFIMLFFFVVSTHLLSSLIIISVLLVFFISKQFSRPNIIALSSILIASWIVFCATTYFTQSINLNLSQSLNLGEILNKNLTTRMVAGSTSHVFVDQLRILYTGLMVGLGAMGILWLVWKRKLGKNDKRLLLLIMSFCLLTVTFAYGGELFMRLYMFSLIPLAYFAAKLLVSHKKVLIVGALFFIIAAPSLTIIAHYGNETIDYVPPSELTGVNYLYQVSPASLIVGGSNAGDFRDSSFRQNYQMVSLYYSVYITNNSRMLWAPASQYAGNETYLCISEATTQFFGHFVGDSGYLNDLETNASQSIHYNLVYSNPSMDIYESPQNLPAS